MYCNKCGNEIPDGSEFCSKCGTKLNQNKKQKVKKQTSKSTRIVLIVLLSLLFIYFVIMLILGIKNNKVYQADPIAFGCSLVLLFLIGYGLVSNILKLVRKDKEYTSEQLQKRKKRKIIILGISAFVIIILCITLYKITDNLFKLQYNTRYIYEDTYITFFENGTYERNVEGIIKTNYTFNKETKEIVCKEVQFVIDSEIDVEMHYEYLNENEIKKTSMKILGRNYESEYGQIFSTENTLKEKEEKTEEQEIVKDTRMLHEEDDYEYIGFSSNSLQRMLLAFYEDGRLGIRTYTLNKYNGQYEQVGNIIWSTYQVKHNVIYANNSTMTITSPDEVSKVQLFKYNGMDFTPVKVDNGNKQANTDIQISNDTIDNTDNIDREELIDTLHFLIQRGWLDLYEGDLQLWEQLSTDELKQRLDKLNEDIGIQEQYNNKYANQLYEIFSKEVNVELYTSENNNYKYTPSNISQPKAQIEYVALNEDGVSAIYYSIEMTLTITNKNNGQSTEETTKKYYKATNIQEFDKIIKINNYDTQNIQSEINKAIVNTKNPIDTAHSSALSYYFHNVGNYVLYYLPDERREFFNDYEYR